jgi:hypothetical protein
MKHSMPARHWIVAGVTLGALAAGLPAQASEVVKLARLVVTGKRAAAEAPRSAPPQARRPADAPSNGAGGSDDTGTAPAPSRGIS